MVEIAPFKALRLRKSDISKYICPPYDVISSEKRAALVRASINNVVRVELPAGAGDLKYLQASRFLRKWKEQGLIQEDRLASFYLLETTFRVKDVFAPKSILKRYGVLVALRLEVPGKGAVLPHERTFPKAKEDRLNLLNSIQTNTSPIFGLFFDKKKEWRKWVKAVTRSKPLVKGKESADLKHRLWKIEHPVFQKSLRKLLKKKEIYIADGHHRYEVAWAYKELRLKSDPSADLSAGWQSVMTLICPMDEPGLLMLPTHRLAQVHKSHEEWLAHLGSLFDIMPVKSPQKMTQTLLKAGAKDRWIGWLSHKGPAVLKLKKGISLDRCLAHRSKPLRQLDVILLHDVILGEYGGAQYVKDKNIFYTQDILGMAKKTKEDASWSGFVLRSAGVESLARVAAAGEVMPPKTTYFYPKVPTGFALMSLNQGIV